MGNPIRIALLECDTLSPAVQKHSGGYWDVFNTLLKASGPGIEFILDGYDVVKEQKYPDVDKKESEGGYRGILVSGSAASAYEDLPWINKLVSFISKTTKTRPQIKFIGICFGHQIIARALGGSCVPNNGRWEVGVTDVELTQLGKEIFQTDRPIISIQQMHRDHVPTLPPSFHILGSSPMTPIQGYILPYDPSQPLNDPTNIQIFSVQGHPEFTSTIVDTLIDAREESKIFTPEVAKEGRERAVRLHDGLGAVGSAVWRVLGATS